MHNYSPLASESNSSFLNQNLDPVKSSNNTAKRRFSLQNPLSPMPTPALTKFNPNDTFVDHTNLNEMRKISGGPFPANLAQYQSPPVTYDPTSTYSKFLFHQQQQQQSQLQQLQQKQRQQQAAQNQENFSNFVRLCNYSGIDLNTDLNNNENSFFSGYSNGKIGQSKSSLIFFECGNFKASTSDSYSISSSQSSLSSQPGTSMFGASNPLMSKMSSSGQQSLQQQLNRRRCSYGPSASSLHTVMESRSSSPFVPPPLDSPSTYLDPQLEKKLNLLINSNLLASEPAPSAKSIRGSTNSLTTLTTDKSRNRAMSTGSSVGSYDISGISNKLIFNDPFEEKLATTGNIFEKREDWSVLSRIPIAKQNTIHIRLEDEGPYGNDETRCFVLSHFSSLGIKQLKCVFCSCDLIVYDRFPLIDGIYNPFCLVHKPSDIV